nr:MAG TPA: hypothetical protein [Caudoviricetes sp.]
MLKRLYKNNSFLTHVGGSYLDRAFQSTQSFPTVALSLSPACHHDAFVHKLLLS